MHNYKYKLIKVNCILCLRQFNYFHCTCQNNNFFLYSIYVLNAKQKCKLSYLFIYTDQLFAPQKKNWGKK